MKKILDIIKDKLFRKDTIKYIMIFIIIVLVYLIITNIIGNNKNTSTYNELQTTIKNKDSIVIYYYNSRSSNKNNKKVIKYLDKLGIRYYKYNDVYVDKKEYNRFLKLVGIDKKLFGTPSLIYIRDGKMFGNLINIDSTKVVKQFIDSYDLYTVK